MPKIDREPLKPGILVNFKSMKRQVSFALRRGVKLFKTESFSSSFHFCVPDYIVKLLKVNLMNHLALSTLLSLTFSGFFASTVHAANPPLNNINSFDFGNLTVATDDSPSDRSEPMLRVAGLPPSGDMNPSDMWNPTVDTSEVLSHEARPQERRRTAAPHSGDMNPSDLGNATVDTSEVLSHEARPTARRAGFPPSGDMNPSDRANRTVDTSEID